MTRRGRPRSDGSPQAVDPRRIHVQLDHSELRVIEDAAKLLGVARNAFIVNTATARAHLILGCKHWNVDHDTNLCRRCGANLDTAKEIP